MEALRLRNVAEPTMFLAIKRAVAATGVGTRVCELRALAPVRAAGPIVSIASAHGDGKPVL